MPSPPCLSSYMHSQKEGKQGKNRKGERQKEEVMHFFKPFYLFTFYYRQLQLNWKKKRGVGGGILMVLPKPAK